MAILEYQRHAIADGDAARPLDRDHAPAVVVANRPVRRRSLDVPAGDRTHQTHASGVPCTARLEDRLAARQVVEALLEPARVRALGARQGLEPLGDLLEALLARGLGEPWVHLRVLVRLARDGGLEVLHAVAD